MLNNHDVKAFIALFSRPIKYQGYLDMNANDLAVATKMVQLWVDIAVGTDLSTEYAWDPIAADGSGNYLNLAETFDPVLPDEYLQRMSNWEADRPWSYDPPSTTTDSAVTSSTTEEDSNVTSDLGSTGDPGVSDATTDGAGNTTDGAKSSFVSSSALSFVLIIAALLC